MAFIIGILLTIGMWYIVYQHFAAPFKLLKKSKELKKLTNDINKFEEENKKIANEILNDPIYQKRIAPLKQDLINEEITYETFKEISKELAKERYYELYEDDEYDEEDEDETGKEQEENNNTFRKILYILMIFALVSSIAFYLAKYITRSQLN